MLKDGKQSYTPMKKYVMQLPNQNFINLCNIVDHLWNGQFYVILSESFVKTHHSNR